MPNIEQMMNDMIGTLTPFNDCLGIFDILSKNEIHRTLYQMNFGKQYRQPGDILGQ
jgi:hypothetical protein